MAAVEDSWHGKKGSERKVEVAADGEGEVTDSEKAGWGDYARMDVGVMLTGGRRGGGCIFSFPIGILPDTLPVSLGGGGRQLSVQKSVGHCI